MWRTDSLKRPWCWERLKVGEKGGDRVKWLDDITEAAVPGVAKSRTWLSNWTELWLFGFLWLPESSAVTQLCAAGQTWGLEYILPRRIFNQEPVGVSACAWVHAQTFGLFATLWTIASQAPLSMWIFRQNLCWNKLLCPPSGHLPDPGIKPMSFTSPALAGGFFTTSAT